MSFALNHETLPTELWLEIFAHLGECPYTTSYTPFQPLLGGDVKSAYTSVVLVCRNWHAWAIGLLWCNFKFPDTASTQADDSLMDIQRKYGKWVQRVVLPYSSTVTESYKPILSTNMLELYPNLQILIRPPHRQSPFQTLRYDFDTTCPPLFSLRRLDWWHYSDASRTGGINSLMDVLSAAPNLEYLFVGVEHWQPTYFPHPPLLHIHLTSLRTLRLSVRRQWVRVMDHILKLSLPALETLIIDAAVADERMTVMWETFGSQFRVVEFGKGVRFGSGLTCLQTLQTCPSLRELNYYLFKTPLPETGPDIVYPSLTSIGFHVGDISPAEWELVEWEFLEQHFNVLVGGMLPDLRHLRVFGAGEQVFAHIRFRALHERLTAQGYVLEVVTHSSSSTSS
ncbi:hypothetical protein C8F04DRAFT_1026238 [Mycena alexandri]|uniref:F-box domain-containing protein n=1 Tax=Mycena alexandri TaxID=1745969 RepID=A0AAD6TGL9_9AGAR|nr:hypothetical protein C8F04DRAFT_1026238 [Mycena alexandri]